MEAPHGRAALPDSRGTERQGRVTVQLGAREVRGTERQGQLAEQLGA
jgi:hypothetical protein